MVDQPYRSQESVIRPHPQSLEHRKLLTEFNYAILKVCW